MITSLRIRHFKNHADTRLGFGRFTVLAGPNGSGKTNALRALESFRKMPFHVEHRDFADSDDLLFDLEGNRGNRFWKASCGPANNKLWVVEEAAGAITTDLQYSLRGLFYFKPDLEKLRGPSYTLELPPTIKPNGAEFASAVAYMMTKEPKRFEAALAASKTIFPWLKRIRADRETVNLVRKKTFTAGGRDIVYDEAEPVPGDSLRYDVYEEMDLKGSDMSDGTLYLLAVMFLIHTLQEPAILLLDDIEQGLHPRAQRDLVLQLKELLKKRKELQIITTTHSPFVIDEFSPEDVWLLTPDENGISRAKRLADHPNQKEALKVLTPGELWASEGEAWVLKQPTSKKLKPNAVHVP
jgi:ABC-type cobalamin/Fe3+-siderophores transport system ATPase subunit